MVVSYGLSTQKDNIDMRSKIITSITNGYKGWEIYIIRGYNNSNDLLITISPGVKIDPINTAYLTDRERMKLHLDLQRKRERYSHKVRVKATERLLFIFKVTPWDHAKEEAKKFIDNKLGAFDLNKFVDAV